MTLPIPVSPCLLSPLSSGHAERTYPCRLHVDFQGSDRILGRDVLNRMDVLFRGLRGEVAVDPDE